VPLKGFSYRAQRLLRKYIMCERGRWTDLDELEYQVSFDMPLFKPEKPKSPTPTKPIRPIKDKNRQPSGGKDGKR